MREANNSSVVVVDFWGNGFGMRVRIALEEKGIKYEYREEDLTNPQRSQLVLDMNPVRKSVPILIHRGQPVCDSAAILEYIDETWKDGFPSLLPRDPYDRAIARFWTDFVDNKVFSTQAMFLRSKGDRAKEESKNELIGELKQLEAVLGDEQYFGGANFGYLDVVLIPFSSMFYGYESHGNFKLEEECPKLSDWVKRCLARDSVRKVLPDSVEMYELHKKFYGIE
ncbi:probable glutathione S-transferase parC [Coffea eugenioides]|uniref:probable glutathione S-transferase parC n=1 Tax=Coffea eugenioides TaxID=49369 RepID=UPI000F6119D3|nr:probable glutathione S-transferase parC [Coffea eugenioides]